ncbi:WhiB family transcriptional regulator [Gordonia sp. NPDC003585]|uniref:WhiB family transcriptional regulator n=1 Tax=Gordonia sp. NPDC003585 TaxID=3154275 RepID=UPI0033A0DB8E
MTTRQAYSREYQRRRALARHRDPDVVTLLESILAGSADLHGAACTATPRLFDPDVTHSALGFPTAHARADAVETVCVGCPVRDRCWEWAHHQPKLRVTGPTAASRHVAQALTTRSHSRARRTTDTPTVPTCDAVPTPTPSRRGARRRIRGSRHRRRR